MPRLSAIVIIPDGLSTVGTLLRHLRAQTVRDLELVLVAPPGCIDATARAGLGDFASVQVVESTTATAAHARAAGIRAATSPVIALTEDHSLPEPGWAEALLRPFAEGCAVAGPEVANGNPGTLVSWGNFLIEYGEWSTPAPAGAAAHLPGHNSAYRREVLLALGDALPEWLEAESLLHWHLRAAGHRLVVEPAARARRLAYATGAPAIPWVRLLRLLRALRRPGQPAPATALLLTLLVLLLSVDATGECLGYLLGARAAARYLADIDFHRERFMLPSEGWLLA